MLKLELNEGYKQIKKVDLDRFVDNKDFRLTSENDFCDFVDFVLDLADFKDLEEKKYDKIRCIKNYREIQEKSETAYYTNIRAINEILKDINVLFLGGYYLSKTLLLGEKDGYCWDLVKAYRFESEWNSDEYYEINEIEDLDSSYDLFIMENGSRRLAYNCNADSRFLAHNVWCDIDNFNHTDFFENDRFYDYYNSCEYCGDIFEDGDMDLVYIERLGCVCVDCAENEGFVRCQDTGEWVDAPYSRDCGDCCCCGCEDCPFYQGFEEEEEEFYNSELNDLLNMRLNYKTTHPIGVINGRDFIEYNTKTADLCRKNGVYFGIEIESKIRGIKNADSFEFVKENLSSGLFEAKYDCTISQDSNAAGFEFVSKTLFNIFDLDSLFRFKDFVRNLENAGFFADSACGAHIHLDRNGLFTSEEFVKMAYKIEKSSNDDIENLFGRCFMDWCGRLGCSCWANAIVKSEIGENWDKVLEGLNYGSHHYFINIKEETNTVEFRLFAGTVNFYRIMRNISVLKVLHKSIIGKSFEELEKGWNDEDYESLRAEMLKLKEVGLINELC
jgi:hypothetical protein